MKYSKLSSLLALAGGSMLAASQVSAATILIDFSTRGGSPVSPAGDGKYWNSLGGIEAADASITGLVSSTNVATGFNLSVDVTNVNSGGTSGAGWGGSGISGPAAADPFDEANAVIDGLFANNNANGTATISLSNLAASTTYNFSLIGGRASNGRDGGIDILSGSSSFSTYTLPNNGTVLNFSATSTASGVIAFRFREGIDNTDSTNSTLNAMSFAQVPEPSSALLSGLGMLALLRRRRA